MGTTLPETLVVGVTRDGDAWANVNLRWEMVGGGGTIELLDNKTDNNGRARARVTLDGNTGLRGVMVRTPRGSVGYFRVTGIEATEGPTTATSVVMDAGDTTLEEGETLSISAVGHDAKGNEVATEPTWSSYDPAVASVDAQGMVTALKAGVTAITARVDDAAASLQLTVEAPPAPEPAAPGSVGDLSVVSATETSVTLRWTQVDDGTGTPARYTIRSGTPTIDWTSAAASAKSANGNQIGGSIEYTWTSLSSGTDYQFRLVAYRRAADGSITYGDLSNVTSGRTIEAPVVPAVARVTAQQASAALTSLGATAQLSATAYDTNGATVAEALTWSSLQPGIAQVSPAGRVTSVATGQAAIVVSAACCNVADTVQVTVTQVAASVTVAPASLTLPMGGTSALNASILDANGHAVADASVTWSSSNGAIASVDGQGRVAAAAAGTTTIQARAGQVTGTVQATVQATTDPTPKAPSTVSDLRVAARSESSITLRWTDVDDGTGNPARYSIRSASPTLDWGSAAETAQYVSGTNIGGTVELTWTGLSAGTQSQFRLVSYRRASDGSNVYGGLSNVVSATTDSPTPSGPTVARVTAQPGTVFFTALGAAFQLSAGAYDAAGASVNAALAWSSLQPGVAQVSSSGRVNAVATGSARIVVSASSGTVADTVEVTVTQDASRVVITPSSLSLTVGQSGSLSASVLDANGFPISGAPIAWSASNAGVASVNGSGQVVGNGVGTASVYATSGLLRGAVTVTVASSGSTDPEPPTGGTSGAVFEENWDFASTADLRSQPTSRFQFPIWANTGGSLSLATGMSGTPWGGSKAIRTHWGGGPYNVHNDEQIGIDVLLPREAQATEIWIEIPLMYSSNFYVESDHKTMFVFEEDGSRWEMRFGAYGNRAQAKLDNGNVQVATDASGRELDIRNPVLVWDGKWHVMRLHLRTGSNGIFQTWLDGKKIIDRSFSPGSASPFNKIALGRNGDPVEASDLYWGAVKVFTSNPGW